MKYFWYLPKKSKFSFYFFFRKGKKLNFFPSQFSLILLVPACLVGIILGANCGANCLHRLHQQNGLQCHFNEWIKRNSRFKKAA